MINNLHIIFFMRFWDKLNYYGLDEDVEFKSYSTAHASYDYGLLMNEPSPYIIHLFATLISIHPNSLRIVSSQKTEVLLLSECMYVVFTHICFRGSCLQSIMIVIVLLRNARSFSSHFHSSTFLWYLVMVFRHLANWPYDQFFRSAVLIGTGVKCLRYGQITHSGRTDGLHTDETRVKSF